MKWEGRKKDNKQASTLTSKQHIHGNDSYSHNRGHSAAKNQRLSRLVRQKRKNRRWQAAATLLSAVIVFVTMYFLVLPAITLTKKQQVLECQYQTHVHNASCYSVSENGETVLVCGRTDWTVHEHNEDCYAQQPVLDEQGQAVLDENGQPQTEKVLVCTLPEIKAHKHTSQCYKTAKVLTCTQEDHTHDSSCYEEVVTGTKKVLTCGYKEGEKIGSHMETATSTETVVDEDGNESQQEVTEEVEVPDYHHHDESCYEEEEITEKQLVCGKAEHKHGKACYSEQNELICGEAELHHHTIDCYEKGQNGESPEKMGWVWYDKDENGNKVLAGDPSHLICGKLELLEHQHGADCIREVEVEDTESGDSDKTQDTVEPGTDTSQYATESEKTENEGTKTLTTKADGCTVKITFDEKADIPDDAELVVTKIENEGEIAARKKEAENLIKDQMNLQSNVVSVSENNHDPIADSHLDKDKTEESKDKDVHLENVILTPVGADEFKWMKSEINLDVFELYDVSIRYQGKEIEPASTVHTEMAVNADPFQSADAMTIVHYADEGTEIPEIKAIEKQSDGTVNVMFDTDSFSPVSVVSVLKDSSVENGGTYVLYRAVTETENGVSVKKYYAIGSDGMYHKLDLDSSGSRYSQSTIDGSLLWKIEQNSYFSLSYPVVRNYEYDIWLNAADTEGLETFGVWTVFHEQDNGGFFIQSFDLMGANGYLRGDDTNKTITGNNDNGNTFFVMKVTEGTATPSGSGDTEPTPSRGFDREGLQEWYDSLNDTQPITSYSKTAEVYDYDNRIYRVDITGRSGVEAMASDLNLAFVTDVSNSMLFPYSLTPVKDAQNNEVKLHLNDNEWNNLPKKKADGSRQVYIIVADPAGTSTNYAVWYDYDANDWLYVDASYYAKNQATAAGVSGLATRNPSNFESLSNQNYRITNKCPSDGLYPVYYANEDWDKDFTLLFTQGANRLFHLKNSVGESIQEIRNIASEKAFDKDVDVNVAFETFARHVYDRYDFRKVTGENGQTNVDFIQDKLSNITSYDGTRQDKALLGLIDSTTQTLTLNPFSLKQEKKDTNMYDETITTGYHHDETINWPQDFNSIDPSKKYVIMITDGAPLVSSKQTPSDMETLKQSIITQKNKLAEKGIELICIGLGMEKVYKGQEILNTIADTDSNGIKWFYKVEKADDLKYVLLDILRNIMASTSVQGRVEDVIDPVFYPVDKATGKPLEDGDKITLDGDLVKSGSPLPSKYGTIKREGNDWKVIWTNQDFPYGSHWHGTFYAKTKEDFLGGNSINTNKGEAKIVPEQYTVSTTIKQGNQTKVVNRTYNFQDPSFTDEQRDKTVIKLPTPYVNIDELQLTKHDTTWTVYLDSMVDPKEAIRNLYNAIDVEEVVTSSDDSHRETNANAMMYDLATEGSIIDYNENDGYKNGRTEADRETFLLKTVAPLSETDLQTLVASGEVNIQYNHYNHDKVGYIRLTLQKNPTNASLTKHPADKSGERVETYSLKAEYIAYDNHLPEYMHWDDNEDWEPYEYHTGNYLTNYPGNATDQMTSINTHVINVFQKGIQINKVDQFHEPLTSDTAIFTLYKTDEEHGNAIDGLPNGKYIAAATLTTDKDGIASLTPVQQIFSDPAAYASETVYYLKETKTPAGYNTMPGSIKVKLVIHQETTNVAKVQDVTLNNIIHTATIEIEAADTVDKTETEKCIVTGHEAGNPNTMDNITSYVTYSIVNSSGVELPHTGGMGTASFYIVGCMLLLMVLCFHRFKNNYFQNNQ